MPERVDDGHAERSLVAPALDLVDDSARPGSWSHDDPMLLQAQGLGLRARRA
ncbi:MAG: hypothetical protein WKF41_07790 [Gaiellaceae bacterium]